MWWDHDACHNHETWIRNDGQPTDERKGRKKKKKKRRGRGRERDPPKSCSVDPKEPRKESRKIDEVRTNGSKDVSRGTGTSKRPNAQHMHEKKCVGRDALAANVRMKRRAWVETTTRRKPNTKKNDRYQGVRMETDRGKSKKKKNRTTGGKAKSTT